jgi:outer membrane protein
LPPTVSAQYYFLEANSEWQPYVGLGINYTMFFDESVSRGAKNALGAQHLSLDDSIGVAGEVGLDWRVDKNWLVNASIWRAQIETDASVDTALGRVKTTVALDPWVYMVAVGYKF